MAKQHTHTCIAPSCSNTYKDTDPDPYYCPSCQDKKKKVAKQIDAKYSTMNSTPEITPLQEYDESEKVHGFMRVRL